MILHTLGTKVNFIDADNTLVGFDTDQSCCEHARWWISDHPLKPKPTEVERAPFDLELYFFDRDYVETKREPENTSIAWEYDNRIAFKLIAIDRPALYLTLANGHNGYYSHGFNVDIGGKTIWEGSL